MMSNKPSPVQFTDELDHTIYDPEYTAFINNRMRIPERLKVDGTSDDLYSSTVMPNEVFDMRVPERILVAGNDQHIAGKGIPREIEYDNAVMPLDPGKVRVKTPPRVIKLDEHHYPSAFDFEVDTNGEKLAALVRPKPRYAADHALINREVTPPIGATEGLTQSEEITHLRRQMAKLNRRVMAIELENIQRQQREKVFFGLGLAYFVLKALLWMTRSS